MDSARYFLCSYAESRRCSADASPEFVLRCSHLESGHHFYVDSWLTGGLMVDGHFCCIFVASFGLLFGVEPPGQCTGTGPCIISLSDLHRRGAFVAIHIPSRKAVSETTTTGVYPKRAHFLCVCSFFMDPSEQPVTGAAQRRKQRRLRSRRRHEQLSIAAALATSLHHSSRGQKKARAWERRKAS